VLAAGSDNEGGLDSQTFHKHHCKYLNVTRLNKTTRYN